MDLFISVAYDYYFESLNHKQTIVLQPEEHKQIEKRQEERPSKEVEAASTQNLRYPGKVLCIENTGNLSNNMLVVSDSANNRVLIINEETLECTDCVGSGKVGLVDGAFSEVQMHHPQGLCHVFREGQHFIYVCDTKNHAIREINLQTKEVLTVVGTGEKGFDKEGNKSVET